MSAAANAAGYLYVHDKLPVSHPDEQAPAERPPLAPRTIALSQDRQICAPRIEYRKRRAYGHRRPKQSACQLNGKAGDGH